MLIREEMQRFLIQAKEEGYFELFLLELATGLRRGEVLQEYRQQVDSQWMFSSPVKENPPLDPATCRKRPWRWLGRRKRGE